MPCMPSDLIGAFHILLAGREKNTKKVNFASCFHGLFSLTDFHSKHSEALHGITKMSRATSLTDFISYKESCFLICISSLLYFLSCLPIQPSVHPSVCSCVHTSVHSSNYQMFIEQLPGIVQFSSIQLLSHVQLFATLWTAAHQASLSITNSQSLLKLMSIESVMPSNHLILCRPLLLLPSIFPRIRVFSSESVFKSGDQSIGVSASASVLPMNIQD